MLLKTLIAFKAAFKTLQPSAKAKMAKINSKTLLTGGYLLLQNAATITKESCSPNHIQLNLFVPLPLPAPGSAPGPCIL